jgi:hypothetical protein
MLDMFYKLENSQNETKVVGEMKHFAHTIWFNQNILRNVTYTIVSNTIEVN